MNQDLVASSGRFPTIISRGVHGYLIRIPLSAILAMCACTLHAQSQTSESASRPNVVFILADDLGWSDTTLFETTKFYNTPHIERLAQRGMTFTHAYSSSPLCSPTRSAILTGLSPARTGITTPNCHLPLVRLQAIEGKRAGPNQKATQPDPVTRLDPKYYTLAEMFRDNGYATGHFGKWHLGSEPYSPLEHGFDVDIPHWPGPGPAGSFVAPWKHPDFDPNTPDEHIEDRMAQEAVQFMESHRGQPFFLNYWMFSVHAPFDAKRDLIEAYRQKVDTSDPQRSPTYAAMIESMDDAVGTLLTTLDRLKLSENTIVIFASDNGGNMYNEVDGTTPTSNTPLRGGKATMYEGGVRGPAVVAYPGFVPPSSRSDEVIQSEDFYPTLLELLAIEPQPGQSFDGISIVPALQGQRLDRQAIFTYFPHSPGIPEWLPPAVSVHQNDWKLIRLFHNGENGSHRYKLFNLNEDLGETKNLASEMPDRVATMDALIEAFLNDRGAVRPLPNPAFDPSKYNANLEGKAKLKGGASTPRKRNRKPGKPVAGWTPGGTCSLAVKDGRLIVVSDGSDPYLSASLTKPIAKQPLVLRVKMSSQSSGRGQVFWTEQDAGRAFAAERSVWFDVDHGGRLKECEIPFTPSSTPTSIRIDPARAPGKVTIVEMQLAGQQGDVLADWRF